jgi:putative SOS response-associated peptidase YedK
MCGRFALTASPEELTRVFGLAECPDVAPLYNIAPATDIAVVRQSPTGAPVLHQLRWGLVPHWSQDPTRGPRPINARSETVTAKPAFREAFLKRRCLIPADGFYEWQAQGRTKHPFFFSDPPGPGPGAGGSLGSLAGPGGRLVKDLLHPDHRRR